MLPLETRTDDRHNNGPVLSQKTTRVYERLIAHKNKHQVFANFEIVRMQ